MLTQTMNTLPLGIDHKTYIRNLQTDEQRKDWKVFTDGYWRRPLLGAPLEKTDYLFKRGFYQNRQVIYNQFMEQAENYLSDFQAMRLPSANGIYANVVADKLLFNHAVSNYFKVPKIYAFRGVGSDEVVLDPTWKSAKLGAGSPIQIFIQPLLVNQIGRSESIRIAEGQFEGLGRSGDVRKISAIVKDWADAVSSPYLIGEDLKQGQFAESLNPGTKNYLTVALCRNFRTWEPHIFAVSLSIGIGSTGTEQGVEGGCLSVDVQPEEGIFSAGVCVKPGLGLQRSRVHPDSLLKIEGLTIPGWQNIRQRLIRMMDESSYLRCVVIKFALIDSDKGNGECDLGLIGPSPMDVASFQVHRPLLSDPVFTECINKFKL